MKVLSLIVATVVFISLAFSGPVRSAPEYSAKVKELNFVFLHGAGGHPGSLQLLEDSIIGQLQAHIRSYEQDNPDIKIRVATLKRFYPNDWLASHIIGF